MLRISKGDNVIVIAGKEKGKKGTVLRIVDKDYVVVQNINLIKKHQKPNPATGNAGGIIEREMRIHISNVAIFNSITNKADKVGFIFDSSNNKKRIFKSTGKLI